MQAQIPFDSTQVLIGGRWQAPQSGQTLPLHDPHAEALLRRLASNAQRAARVDEIDAAITAWTVQRPVDQVVRVLQAVSVPAGRIYTVADIAADPHYQARGMLQQVTMADGRQVAVPGICPKLSATPGQHRRNAPDLGQDSDAVLAELGLSPEQIQRLRAQGIVN